MHLPSVPPLRRSATSASLAGLLALALAVLPACDSAVEAPILVTGLPNQPGGNPLVPRVAAYPYPSNLYLTDDPSTRTGKRVAFTEGALPDAIADSLFAGHDGFSRVSAMLAHFPEGIDPSSLPDPSDRAATLDPESTVLVLAAPDWQPVAVLAELDANARSAAEQALILRPHQTLAAATTHVVVLRTSLRDEDGAPLQPGAAYVALRDGTVSDLPELEAQRADHQQVAAAIAAAGLEPTDVALAWSFDTRSEGQVVRPLLSMTEQLGEASLDGWTLDDPSYDAGGRKTIWNGTFTVPDFRDADGLLRVDADDNAVPEGIRVVPFVLTVPDEVTGPRPVIAFGHGFFSDRTEATRGSFLDGLRQWQASSIAIDFEGFSEADLLPTFQILSSQLERLPVVIGQQSQNVATFTPLARMVTEELAGLELQRPFDAAPFTPLDPTELHYLGISNGGTQGLTLMSTSSVFARGVLVVPGGGWTHMLQRAVQWNELGGLVVDQLPQLLELQLAMAALQNVFDPADSLNYVEHLVGDRFDGLDDVAVTLHMARHDSQVANLVTEWCARTAGVPLVQPSPVPIWGLDSLEAPAPDGVVVPAALFVYDEGVAPNPEGNVAPESDNETHDTVRRLESYRDQVGAFLEDGRVVHLCDGPCDPE